MGFCLFRPETDKDKKSKNPVNPVKINEWILFDGEKN